LCLIVPAILCAPVEPTKDDAIKAADALAGRTLFFKWSADKEVAALCDRLYRHQSGEPLTWPDRKALLDRLWGGFAVRREASDLLKSHTRHGAWARERFRRRLVDRLRTVVRNNQSAVGLRADAPSMERFVDKLLASL